jgi:acyl-CoA synthetase (AMP-forming)/AMP-acid ligase II
MSAALNTNKIWTHKGKYVEGLIQTYPLLISDLLKYAARYHSDVEIVSRVPELLVNEPSFRYTYSQLDHRTKQCANALINRYNIHMGDCVGTLAFNHHRHLECYYAISGIGAILHTINPRLFPDQIEYIINHAEDKLIFVDTACVDILLQVLKRGNIECKRFVILTSPQYMDRYSLLSADCYESIIAAESKEFIWPTFPETQASSLCYTSGNHLLRCFIYWYSIIWFY